MVRDEGYRVRIENVMIENFKNVANGCVCFNEYPKMTRKQLCEEDFTNVLGIYGQNASGKTTVIDVLTLIRHLISGGTLNSFTRFNIRNGESFFTIGADFLIRNDNSSNLLNYSITISNKDERLCISEEKIELSEFDEETQRFGNKTKPFTFINGKGINPTFLAHIGSSNNKAVVQYLSSKGSELIYDKDSVEAKTDKGQLTSTIFNSEIISLLNNEKELLDFSKLLNTLISFCKERFLIVNTSMYSDISKGIVGINGYGMDENLEKVHENFLAFFGRQIMSDVKFKAFEKTLRDDGMILESLVPGLTIKPHVYKEVLNANGEKSVEFEIMSVRDGKEIPLFYESRGIKQLLIFIGDLIEVFNEDGTFIAIDELDSGIFEYLLGELIYTFDNYAQGQLLFTSHNFRTLEKIKPNEIYFTVLNDKNKYIRPRNIKNTNNLRNVYYKLIAQGDGDNVYYNKTSSSNIAMAFYKMKRTKGDE